MFDELMVALLALYCLEAREKKALDEGPVNCDWIEKSKKWTIVEVLRKWITIEITRN